MTSSQYAPEEAQGLWVHVEAEDGELAGVSRELLTKGRELATALGVPLTGLLAGRRVVDLAWEAVAHGADRVLYAEDPRLEPFTVEPHAAVIEALALRDKPDILLFGATAQGRDLAGRLAVRFRTGLTADCIDLALEEGTGLLLGEVAGFGGGILATIKCEHHRPQMATVRPGVFVAGFPDPARQGDVCPQHVELEGADRQNHVLERSVGERVDITQAERIVVAGGGTAGDLHGVRRLAALIGAELGATRVAADAGWISHERMIGQTGSAARPRLAILCGVSGAMQFTVGIDEAEVLVAINSDPEASVFEVADYGIVGELETVLPALLDELDAAPAQEPAR
jgi:electron transfer flavoprotein alpha subunit